MDPTDKRELVHRLRTQIARVADLGPGHPKGACCIYGPCATHLAEEHPDGGTASVHPAEYEGGGFVLGNTWNHGEQAIAMAIARANYGHALDRLLRRAAGVES